MQLKIQTKPPEGMKSEQRDPVKMLKAFNDLEGASYSVLGVPYGGPLNGKDSDGQYFSAKTDTWLKAGDEIPVTYYHGFGPDSPQEWQDPPAVIGSAQFTHTDARGHWFDVKFDTSEPLTGRITGVKADIVRASSGAVGHLVRASEDGEITTWPLGELALFDTNEWRKPANDYAVFMAKGEAVAEDSAKAQDAQPESVDDSTPAASIETPTQEKIIMEDEIKEVKQEVDIAAIVSELAAIKALINEKPLNAPVILKAENMGDPDPNKAFIHYLKTGERIKGLKVNTAPMGEATAAQGGVLVPDDFYNGIIEKRNEMSIPRQAGATIFQTSRDVINVPIESTSSTYFGVGTEISAVQEDEPYVNQVSITVYPWTKIVKVSDDLLEDSAANLSGFLASNFGRWMAMTENRYSLIGTGTNEPQGVLIGGTAALTFDDTNSIAYTEIPELYYKLNQNYRERSSWVANDATIGFLRGLPITNTWAFGPHDIDENKIMGKRYFASTYVPSYTTTAYTSLCVGDWSYWGMAERRGLTIKRLDELYAGTRQVGFLATARWGGRVLQAEAFAVGKQA